MENKTKIESTEEWRTVSWAPDYMVSSLGRVKSLKGGVERLMVGGRNQQWYPHVCIRHDGICTTRTIHRLMSEAFLGHNPNGKVETVVNHIDGNVANNVLSNLEIISQRMNTVVGRVCMDTNSGVHNIEITDTGRYLCRVYLNKRKVSLGVFDSIDDAILRRDDFLRHVNNGDAEEWIKSLIINPDKTSQKIGVFKVGATGKWQSKLLHNKKYYYFGLWDTEKDAGDSLDEAVSKIGSCDFDMWYYTEYMYADRLSGNAGVGLAPSGKYRASAVFRGKHISLGMFSKESDARLAVSEFWKSKRDCIVEDYLRKKSSH